MEDRSKRRLLVVGIAALVLPFGAAAHHGWSEYDQSKTLTIEGKVVESGYEHPHGFVKVESAGKTWMAVLAPPSRMDSRGLKRDAITVGSIVTVVGYVNRKEPDEMRAERITSGGRTVELR